VKNIVGGLAIRGSTLSFEKCEFIGIGVGPDNVGGAMYLAIDDGKSFVVEDSNFDKCFGEDENNKGSGGAIFAENKGNLFTGTLKLKKCKFDLCSGGEGGAVYLRGFFCLLFVYLFIH
jgi:hypothetical protein